MTDLERALVGGYMRLVKILREAQSPVADAAQLKLYWTLVLYGVDAEEIRPLLETRSE